MYAGIIPPRGVLLWGSAYWTTRSMALQALVSFNPLRIAGYAAKVNALIAVVLYPLTLCIKCFSPCQYSNCCFHQLLVILADTGGAFIAVLSAVFQDTIV